MKEVYEICKPKVPINLSKWSYVQEHSDFALQIKVVLMKNAIT